MDYRVILYHKQASSARTRFLKFSYNSVCAFEPIPRLAQLLDRGPVSAVLHPAAILRKVEKALSFDAGILKAETEYRHNLEAPGGSIQILLANIDTMDPPFEQAEKASAHFIDLTQAKGLPQIELELLRFAYELVLGG
jgi:hypothetical protein